MVTLLESLAATATRYARFGFAIFPAHTVDVRPEGTRCSCADPRCPSPGKHPIASLVPHGVSDALADEQAAAEWWAVYPDANIGIATGDSSGIVVVDIDLPGMDTLGNLERLHGEVSVTWAATTGSGGMHLYYRMPRLDVRNSVGAVGHGIDVRGNGGYVIAPPSTHASGRHYQWEPAWHPRRVELGELPDWLLKRMVPNGARKQTAPLPAVLKEGTRNSWLASGAGTMRRRGFSEAAIVAALRAENRARCTPPLDETEVDKIARSIGRYDPADGFRLGA
jgi:putative DNA primase/helicase